MTTCNNCGEKYSDDSLTCPHCGDTTHSAIKKTFTGREKAAIQGFAGLLLIIILLVGIARCSSDNKVDQDDPSAPSSKERVSNNQISEEDKKYEQDAKNAISFYCSKNTKKFPDGDCASKEREAFDSLSTIAKIPKEVSEKCAEKANNGADYIEALKCVTDGMAPTNAQAAAAFSEYAGKAQSQFTAISMLNSIYISKIQQDMQFNDLDKYRKDAEDMLDMAKNGQQKLSELRYPMDLTDGQTEQFNNLVDAISEFSGAIISMNADIAVNAHTGINMASALSDDMREFTKQGKLFRKKVMAGYKYFGYSEKNIDHDTLMIKVKP